MANNKNSYGSILKSTGLFGGVKFFEILIGIIRSKIIAVLLGPAGMGINGLITSGLSFISSLSGLGLGTSGVREVSKAYGTKDKHSIDVTITVLRKLVWITGLVGALFALLLAKQLSVWSFGTPQYTNWFRIVSVTILFDQLLVGQRVLMQGTFHYKYLAKTALFGNLLSLIVAVPFYYLWGIKGIVPVIVLSSACKLVLSWYYAKKVPYNRLKLTIKRTYSEGKTMIGLGFAIALSGAVTLGSEYALRLFVGRIGDVADVGLYNAGISIATAYMGVILTSMGTDYAPRLASCGDDLVQFNQIINRQFELVMVIMAPLIAVFIVFIKEIIFILYSHKFLPISGMIEWIAIGFVFKIMSFCLSYAIVAKANPKAFFWNELISCIYTLVLSAVGYYSYDFIGMGIAYFIGYLLYSVQMFIMCRLYFKFRFETKALNELLILLTLIVIVFISTRFFEYSLPRYIIGCIEIAFISFVSYKYLNKMLDIKAVIYKLLKRKS